MNLDKHYIFLLPVTDEEIKLLNSSDISTEHQQGKTYTGQVQTDCFCQENILDRQTNANLN
jgi:hypothetical protein